MCVLLLRLLRLDITLWEPNQTTILINLILLLFLQILTIVTQTRVDHMAPA